MLKRCPEKGNRTARCMKRGRAIKLNTSIADEYFQEVRDILDVLKNRLMELWNKSITQWERSRTNLLITSRMFRSLKVEKSWLLFYPLIIIKNTFLCYVLARWSSVLSVLLFLMTVKGVVTHILLSKRYHVNENWKVTECEPHWLVPKTCDCMIGELWNTCYFTNR